MSIEEICAAGLHFWPLQGFIIWLTLHHFLLTFSWVWGHMGLRSVTDGCSDEVIWQYGSLHIPTVRHQNEYLKKNYRKYTKSKSNTPRRLCTLPLIADHFKWAVCDVTLKINPGPVNLTLSAWVYVIVALTKSQTCSAIKGADRHHIHYQLISCPCKRLSNHTWRACGQQALSDEPCILCSMAKV